MNKAGSTCSTRHRSATLRKYALRSTKVCRNHSESLCHPTRPQLASAGCPKLFSASQQCHRRGEDNQSQRETQHGGRHVSLFHVTPGHDSDRSRNLRPHVDYLIICLLVSKSEVGDKIVQRRAIAFPEAIF